MRLLTATNHKIQLVTDAAADIEAWGSYVDNASGTITAGGPGVLASITTATTTDVIGVPGASTQRNVTELGCRNNHGSTACNVSWNFIDGTSTVTHYKVNLLAGESCGMDENGNWWHKDSNGGDYPALGNIATQADMEAGTSTTVVVTPGVVQYHPGVAKFWVVAGTTGNILTSYNVTSLTDTGTGVLAITIATDFSSVDYCISVSVEATATTWAVANCRECHIRSATRAVGTVSVDCVDNTATTSLVKDPTTWHVSGHGDQ